MSNLFVKAESAHESGKLFFTGYVQMLLWDKANRILSIYSNNELVEQMDKVLFLIVLDDVGKNVIEYFYVAPEAAQA